MIIVPVVTSCLGVLIALIALWYVRSRNAGTKKMQDVSGMIRKGALMFLQKELLYLSIVVILIAALLWYGSGWITALAFVSGSFLSAFAALLGMNAATLANVRTAQAARSSLVGALRLAFFSGSVMSFAVCGLGLFGIALLYAFFSNVDILVGFGFGASIVALFARVGGGVFTKAADFGADIVGKVESGIPEDDPRNPAVIADNIGDNVGDVAGMGADLFESYAGSIIAASILGILVFGTAGVLFTLLLASTGIIASGVSVLLFRFFPTKTMSDALYWSMMVAGVLVLVTTYFLSANILGTVSVFWAVLVGLLCGGGIGLSSEYYTSDRFAPVQRLASSAKTSVSTIILEGLALGMKSTVLPLFLVIIAIVISFWQAGLFGIAIAAVGMLSTMGVSLAIDTSGPVADNAGGIARMAGLPTKVRKRTDALDALGNTTAAIGKGFAIGSAALTSLALFTAYAEATNISSINVLTVPVLVGLLCGAVLPFVFSAVIMNAVGRSAKVLIKEVRQQLKRRRIKPRVAPDYQRCVSLASQSALREMAVPGVLAVLAPLLVGFLIGPQAVGGLLVGSLIVGVPLSIVMTNAGGAWDNAKKRIERDSKKSVSALKSSIVGDTVGDPLKDASGPSINILIKVMAMLSLLCAGMLVKYSVF
ncbi:sodium-translocating pyrophosphatase [Candidatus Woesearchaeota archaeon]|nr:sodium-translocating pyrophosphatase [Candidatus Woesearchaeota archaeon]